MPNQVLDSLLNRTGDHCVDLFLREDGSYGFEEYRRDAEDQKGWFSLHRHSGRVFSTQALALESARATVGWLADEALGAKPRHDGQGTMAGAAAAMTQEYLFVYGTLRRATDTRMYHLLAEHSESVGDATCQGRLYRIDWYPGLVPSDDPALRVRGEVYALREPAAILPALDTYEGCAPGSAEPTEYVRGRREVVLGDGRRLLAWIYLYRRPVDGLREIASGDFLDDG